MSDARQKRGKLRYTIAYVIWANKKTESFEYHWFRALAMFDVTSFLAILSGIGRHFKFCRYVNCCPTINIVCTSRPVVKCWPHIWMVLGSILDGCIHKGTNAVCVWPKTKLNRAGEWMWPTRSNQSNNGQFPNCQSWFRVKIVWSLCDLVNTKENILPVYRGVGRISILGPRIKKILHVNKKIIMLYTNTFLLQKTTQLSYLFA